MTSQVLLSKVFVARSQYVVRVDIGGTGLLRGAIPQHPLLQHSQQPVLGSLNLSPNPTAVTGEIVNGITNLQRDLQLSHLDAHHGRNPAHPPFIVLLIRPQQPPLEIDNLQRQGLETGEVLRHVLAVLDPALLTPVVEAVTGHHEVELDVADRGASEESAVFEEGEQSPFAAEVERVLAVEDGQALHADLAVDAEEAGGVADDVAGGEWTDGRDVRGQFVDEEVFVGAEGAWEEGVVDGEAPVGSAEELAGGVHGQMMVEAVVHVRDQKVMGDGDQSQAVDSVSDFGGKLEEREERSGALRLVKTWYNR